MEHIASLARSLARSLSRSLSLSLLLFVSLALALTLALTLALARALGLGLALTVTFTLTLTLTDSVFIALSLPLWNRRSPRNELRFRGLGFFGGAVSVETERGNNRDVSARKFDGSLAILESWAVLRRSGISVFFGVVARLRGVGT